MKITAILAAAAFCVSTIAPVASAEAARGYHRPPHHGWQNKHKRVCRTVWRHHHRQRVCSRR